MVKGGWFMASWKDYGCLHSDLGWDCIPDANGSGVK